MHGVFRTRGLSVRPAWPTSSLKQADALLHTKLMGGGESRVCPVGAARSAPATTTAKGMHTHTSSHARGVWLGAGSPPKAPPHKQAMIRCLAEAGAAVRRRLAVCLLRLIEWGATAPHFFSSSSAICTALSAAPVQARGSIGQGASSASHRRRISLGIPHHTPAPLCTTHPF
jgi:hypothetical protein